MSEAVEKYAKEYAKEYAKQQAESVRLNALLVNEGAGEVGGYC